MVSRENQQERKIIEVTAPLLCTGCPNLCKTPAMVRIGEQEKGKICKSKERGQGFVAVIHRICVGSSRWWVVVCKANLVISIFEQIKIVDGGNTIQFIWSKNITVNLAELQKVPETELKWQKIFANFRIHSCYG